MDRRSFLGTLAAAAAVLSVRDAAAFDQDLEYERALDRVQRDRPRALSWSGRIAPEAEPGTPLLIHGRIFQRDGRTPAPDVIVFGYHTDATGHYDVASAGPHSWRLRGWAKTDAAGRFEFATIRPAPYPSRTQPAHVHFTLELADAPRQYAGLVFDDDPLVPAEERRTSAAAGAFGSVLRAEERAGVQHVTLNIRIGG